MHLLVVELEELDNSMPRGSFLSATVFHQVLQVNIGSSWGNFTACVHHTVLNGNVIFVATAWS
jgi:hypothetical protein